MEHRSSLWSLIAPYGALMEPLWSPYGALMDELCPYEPLWMSSALMVSSALMEPYGASSRSPGL